MSTDTKTPDPTDGVDYDALYEDLKPHEDDLRRLADRNLPLSDRAHTAVVFIDAYEDEEVEL